MLPQVLSLTQTGIANISLNNILLSTFLLFFTAAAWLWLKPLLKENKKLGTENFAGKRFKYNADLFMALLEKQRKVNTTPFENDLQLGNPEAPLQIMVACNPYCGPCAKAHEVLHELLEKNDIGLTVRFTITTENKEDKKLFAAKYIHQLVNGKGPEYKRMVLYDWYKIMDIEKFQQKHPAKIQIDKTNGNETSETVSDSPSDGGVINAFLQQEKWSDESTITFTPTIFINGNEMPKQYNVNDLAELTRGVGEKYKNEIDAVGQMKLQPQY
jgi:thiol-disulfide isomerase/thioredoxin